ncbi:MAG: hemerythrin domain-containing protein [Gemmataceae bacterium]
MMKATEVLMTEHRVIEKVLSCLEAMATQAEEQGNLEMESASQALDFFRGFADHCHHGKEEGYLFPLLEARGLPRVGGPIAVMLHEHEVGRQLLAEMAMAVDQQSPAAFVPPARSYIQLLRDHIWKEDQRLLRMADHLLNHKDDAQLMAAFEKTEQTDMEAGTHGRFHQLANQLANRWGVSHETAGPRSCGGGCSHP